MTNTELAQAISDSNSLNCQNINARTNVALPEGEGIFVVPIGDSGSGISGSVENDVYSTLICISEEDANAVNDLVTTDYEIMSKNGYPG